MTDRSMSGSGARPTPGSSNVPRRLSYASVASGATPQNVPPPTRSGAFTTLVNSPGSSYPPQYHSDQRHQRRQSGYEHDTNISGGINWRKTTPLPSYSRKFANVPGFGPNTMSNAFFIPSYLRHSRYVAKLEAAHKVKVKKEREQPSAPSSNPVSLSTSASNANVHRIAPSHRGMTYDIIESNPPKEEEQLMPLPTKWNDQDKYPGLDVMNDGLDLKYSGSASKAEIEAASVRANYPMSPACGVYYYEVEIKQKSKDTAIAVGFSTVEASLERLPGWETHSWGYHGDDGRIFSGEHSGKNYGPTFSAGDIVGCGVNFQTGQAFFTINGKDLGPAFRDLKNVRPFPSVGMKKYSGALVSVNFGQRPFVYDIEEKIVVMQEEVNNAIGRAKTSLLRPPLDESNLIQELVAHFLAHDGYVETAKAFSLEVRREKEALNSAQPLATTNPSPPEDADAVHRQEIRTAILSGDIDSALKVTHDHYTDVLSQNSQIVFRLKCRKWVELISKAAELRSQQSTAPKARKVSNGFSKSSAVADEFAQEMELDDEPNGNTATNGDATSVDSPSGAAQYDQLMTEAIGYGQILQREYRDEDDGDYKQTLQDIFSLVAYESPKESVHGHLLDPSGRVTVAEELNSAILVSLGRSPSAALDKTYRQTEALIDVLSEEGGPAAFVNLQSTFSS